MQKPKSPLLPFSQQFLFPFWLSFKTFFANDITNSHVCTGPCRSNNYHLGEICPRQLLPCLVLKGSHFRRQLYQQPNLTLNCTRTCNKALCRQITGIRQNLWLLRRKNCFPHDLQILLLVQNSLISSYNGFITYRSCTLQVLADIQTPEKGIFSHCIFCH